MIQSETERYKIERNGSKFVGYEKEHTVLKDNDVVLIQDLGMDIEKSVSEGFDKINASDIIKKEDLVAIKINLGGGIHGIPTSYSDPVICEAIIKKVKKMGAKPFVCEANMRAHQMHDKMLKVRAYYDMLERNETKFVNLSMVEPVEFQCIGLDVPLLLPSILFNPKVKIISFPPPKDHWECGVTLSQKNMYGAIWERKKSIFHRKYDRIDKAVAAAARLMSPDLSVVGCQEIGVGLGPHFLRTRPFNKLIIAQDMIRCDKVGSEILGYPYNLVKYAMINTKGKNIKYKLHPDSAKIDDDILQDLRDNALDPKEVNFWKPFLYFQYFVPHNFQYFVFPHFEKIFTDINKLFFVNK